MHARNFIKQMFNYRGRAWKKCRKGWQGWEQIKELCKQLTSLQLARSFSKMLRLHGQKTWEEIILMCYHSVCGRRSASLGESCVGVGAAILPVLSVNTSDCYGWGNSCDTSWNSGRLENISHSWENAARYCNSLMSPSCSAPPQLKLIWQIKMWKNSNRGSSTHFSLISDKFRLVLEILI